MSSIKDLENAAQKLKSAGEAIKKEYDRMSKQEAKNTSGQTTSKGDNGRNSKN